MPRGKWPAVVAFLGGATWAAAQEPPGVFPPVAEPTPPPVLVGEPDVPRSIPDAKTEITLDKGTQWTASVGFSGPIGAGVSLGILHGLAADVREEDGRVKAVCALPISHCAQGFLLQADAGTGGGKVSLGVGARARAEEEDFDGAFGVALRASLARTWGTPIGTEPGLTYLGPELDLSMMRVDLTLGVLWRVSGSAGPSALFSWGIGLGL